MYRRYSQTGDGAVSMTQVTRNRIKNGIILLLIVATAAVLAFSLPVLSKQNDARRLYIQRIQSETAEAVRQTSGLSRNAGADSAAILARIRCNVYAVRTINSTNSAAGEKALLDEERLTTILNTIDRYLSFLTTGMDTGEYQTNLQNSLEQKKISDSKSQALSYLDLSDIGQQIEKAKQRLADLSGGEENQILAKVSGTVQSVECTAGETKAKDDVLATIEVPDMGYTLSFTVTNDQARRLKPGDSATVSNYYWGSQITATLSSIRTDPKNPQTNKLLTFDLEGDVSAGSELTISVGQKSANYDLVVPNSAIRSDANGKFVLKIEAKSSPLGNRYIARRVAVEVLAEDDMYSAVTGDLSGWGDYVITTANAPVKNGDMVRLADNG